MGNTQPHQQNNGIITLPIRSSSYYRLENVPQWPPFIRGGYRIDQRVWDEFYGHVMSCEQCPDIKKMRCRHTFHISLILLCGLLWFVGVMLICYGGLDMLIEEEDQGWWDSTTTSNHTDDTTNIVCLIAGGLLLIFGLIFGIYAIRTDRKHRTKWINHVRTQLSIKLRYLNAKYDKKLHFTLDQFNVRITIEVKVPNVVFIPDAPQYHAPIAITSKGTNGRAGDKNENQGLIVNEAPVTSGNNDEFIDVQMPDGNIVKCKIVSETAGGIVNYGSANEMNRPLINSAAEGTEDEAYTMK